MTTYQWIGAITIALFVVMLGLMALAFVGHLSLKKVYWISGTALTLLIVLSVLCSVIYMEFS